MNFTKDKTPPTQNEKNKILIPSGQNALIFFGGQSNASSGNSANSLPESLKVPLEGIFIWNQLTQQFEQYQAGVNSNTLQCINFSSSAFGSELKMAINYRNLTGKNVYIVKHAYGGIPFFQRTAYDYNSESVNEGCDHIVTQLNNAINWLHTNQVPFAFKNFVWIHGEQDGNNLSGAANYNANLENFLAKIKQQTNSEFKFIYTRVASPRTYLGAVRSQMELYQQNNLVDKMINVDYLPFFKLTAGGVIDSTHYDWNEINILGDTISKYLKLG